MGLFGKIARLTMDIVETPVAVVKDIATMGGEFTDRNRSYTGEKLEDIQDDWDDIKDNLES